jgi:hypothetical protein
MGKSVIRILISLLFFLFLNNEGTFAFSPDRGTRPESVQDTIFYRQLLYNGRIWRSRFGQILGHEFFLTKKWIPGEVVINNIKFSNVMLRYDLFNDELLLMVNPGTVIILSSEKVGSFTLKYETEVYRFTNYNYADSSLFRGYGYLLYNDKTSIIIKYNKQIKLLAVENRYDEFYQKQQVFILRNGQFNRIRSRKELLSLLADHRDEILKYMREKGLMISLSKPESLIPVLRFYDSLNPDR